MGKKKFYDPKATKPGPAHARRKLTLEEKARAEQQVQQEIDAELAEEENTGYRPPPQHPLAMAGTPETRACDERLAAWWSVPEERARLLRELQSRFLIEQASLHRGSCQIAAGTYTTLAEER